MGTEEPPANPARDAHLFDRGRKRILSLDGGGVRGIITIAFLERLEAILAERSGNPATFRLSDYFDLIGGTSTGAIIATGLAFGMRVGELKKLYLDEGSEVFRKRMLGLRWVRHHFYSRALRDKVAEVLAGPDGRRDVRLGSAELRTGLAVVTKRLNSGSPWVLTNIPKAPFWKAAGTAGDVDNWRYSLTDLIRASTAAPMYFRPHEMAINKTTMGAFVDGGVSPHNNPALQLMLLATLEPFQLNWPLGERELLMISVGAGHYRTRLSTGWCRVLPGFMIGKHALEGMIGDNGMHATTMMQWMSRPQQSAWINAEIKEMRACAATPRPHLLAYQRYDVPLDDERLRVQHGIAYGAANIGALQSFVNPRVRFSAYRLGCEVAAAQVCGAHLPPDFNPPGWASAVPPPIT